MKSDFPPVRLCCQSRHWGPVCPDNTVMCCICFDRIPVDKVFKDDDGKWDMCQPCGTRETSVINKDLVATRIRKDNNE